MITLQIHTRQDLNPCHTWEEVQHSSISVPIKAYLTKIVKDNNDADVRAVHYVIKKPPTIAVI